MRKQVRPSSPQVLSDNAAKWNEQWINKRKQNPKAPFHWYSVDGKNARQWILPALRKMNQEHCSFCDRFPMYGESTEPIEHFRPKSMPEFYHLAYAWSNLYYCCEVCQQKGSVWDEALLEPDHPGYSFERYYAWGFITGEIKPNPSANALDQTRAEVTIRLYNLNHSGRCRSRRLALRNLNQKSEVDENPYRDFLFPNS